jgi:hypothetical protein
MVLDEGRLPTDGEETVDADTAGLERAWLLLRTDAGWPLADAGEAECRLADLWTGQGWARCGGRAAADGGGWLLLDRLAVEMASAAEDSIVPAKCYCTDDRRRRARGAQTARASRRIGRITMPP